MLLAQLLQGLPDIAADLGLQVVAPVRDPGLLVLAVAVFPAVIYL